MHFYMKRLVMQNTGKCVSMQSDQKLCYWVMYVNENLFHMIEVRLALDIAAVSVDQSLQVRTTHTEMIWNKTVQWI